MGEDSEQRNALWHAVQESQKEHVKTSAVFDTLALDEMSLSTNGALEKAAQDRRTAFEKYVQALGSFSRFLKEKRKRDAERKEP